MKSDGPNSGDLNLGELDLGVLDVCIKVVSFVDSKGFYEHLGFSIAEEGEGWGVAVRGPVRLGLFEHQFMGEDAISFNFRGGNIGKIKAHLDEAGTPSEHRKGSRGESLRLRDPDGVLFFFDTES